MVCTGTTDVSEKVVLSQIPLWIPVTYMAAIFAKTISDYQFVS